MASSARVAMPPRCSLRARRSPAAAARRAPAHEPRARRTPRARAASRQRLTVPAALGRLRPQRRDQRQAWRARHRSLAPRRCTRCGGLGGTRGGELGARDRDAQQIAATGSLSASLAPSLFLTLERNTWWWTTASRSSRTAARVSFPPSELVWEHYAGPGARRSSGSATFGRRQRPRPNRPHRTRALRRLAGEVQRAGSRPRRRPRVGLPVRASTAASRPWTSGLTQGTALEMLERSRADRAPRPTNRRPRRRARAVPGAAAGRGAGRDRGAAPSTRSTRSRPRDRILNGFIQADVGLYEYAAASSGNQHGGAAVRRRRRAGDAVETPRFNTGYVVAVRPVRRKRPQLPRAAHRIPAAPVHADADRRRRWRRPPAGAAGGVETARRPVRARRSPATRSTARPPAKFRGRPAHAAAAGAVLREPPRSRTALGELTVRVSKISNVWLSIREPPRARSSGATGATLAGGVPRRCCGDCRAGPGATPSTLRRDRPAPATTRATSVDAHASARARRQDARLDSARAMHTAPREHADAPPDAAAWSAMTPPPAPRGVRRVRAAGHDAAALVFAAEHRPPHRDDPEHARSTRSATCRSSRRRSSSSRPA